MHEIIPYDNLSELIIYYMFQNFIRELEFTNDVSKTICKYLYFGLAFETELRYKIYKCNDPLYAFLIMKSMIINEISVGKTYYTTHDFLVWYFLKYKCFRIPQMEQ